MTTKLKQDLAYLADTASDMSVSSFSHPEDVNVADVAAEALARIEALEAALEDIVSQVERPNSEWDNIRIAAERGRKLLQPKASA